MNNIHRSKKLNRQERINYLSSAFNVINNLRYSHFKDNNRDSNNIIFNSDLSKPIYSWYQIILDIIIGLNLR